MKSSVTGQTFGMIPRWVLAHADLNAQAVRVYGVLAWRIGRDRERALTHEWISRETRCSVSGVKRALADLQAVGAISVEPLFDSDHGGQIGNIYHVHFESILNPPQVTGEHPPQFTGEHPKKDLQTKELLDLPSEVATPESERQTPTPANQEEAQEQTKDQTQVKPLGTQGVMFLGAAWACGLHADSLTPAGRKRVGRVARDLLAAGVTPPELDRFAQDYHAHWPGIDLTPEAMLKHWDAWRAGQFTPAQPKLQTLDALMLQTRRQIDADRSRGEGDGDPAGRVLPERTSTGDDDRGVGEGVPWDAADDS